MAKICPKHGIPKTTYYSGKTVHVRCRKCRSEEKVEWLHRTGRKRPMAEAKECSSYLGVYVAERVLEKFFYHVERMPYGTPGFDYICGKGYKIDVKASCEIKYRSGKSTYWSFRINRNKIADYFLCLAFDDRARLNPLHVWLIPSHVINDKSGAMIGNSKRSLSKWATYEKPLDKVISCCNLLKQEAHS